MRVHLCGVRGSTPAVGAEFVRYGGHTSCLAVAHDGDAAPSLILDAGTGLRAASALLDGTAFIGTILLTHLHWDHVHGLPFFGAGDRDGSRVTLLLPQQQDGGAAVEVLARGMSPPHFPVGPTGLRGDWTFASLAPGEWHAEGFRVLAREVPHKGGRTFGFRVSDGSGTLAYLPDHCPTVFGPGPDGWGQYHDAALELAQAADVLLHDAQLLPGELAAQAQFGHAAADYAVELGRRAGVRAVALCHHAPGRTDDELDALAARLGAVPGVSVSVSAQGEVMEL